MNALQYIEHLQKLIDKNPELAEAELWYAADDEGNMYTQVSTKPSIYYAPVDADYQDESLVPDYHFETDILNENGIYREDFDSEAEYQTAVDEVLEGYKKVILVN